jgi:hypothetical protein
MDIIVIKFKSELFWRAKWFKFISDSAQSRYDFSSNNIKLEI